MWDNILIRYLSYYLGRYTGNNRVLGNIMKYNCSCTYHGTVSDRNATADGSMCTNPHAVADSYRLGGLNTLIPLFGNDRMTGASDDNSRGNEAHVSDRYRTRIKKCNAEVDVGHTEKVSVESIVEMNALLNRHFLIICAENLPEQFLLSFDVRRTGLVVFQYQFMSLVLPVMRDLHHVSDEAVLTCHEFHELEVYGENHSEVATLYDYICSVYYSAKEQGVELPGFKDFTQSGLFACETVGDDTPAAKAGMSGTYYMLEFADWTLDSDASIFAKNNEMRGKPKNIVVMRGDKIARLHFEDRIGVQFVFKKVGEEERQRVLKAYRAWKESQGNRHE